MNRWRWPLAVAAAAIAGAVVMWLALAPKLSAPEARPGEWKLSFEDNFNQPELLGASGGDWGAYSGQPGGNVWGLWSPQNLSIGNGEMLLKTTKEGSTWVTAGVGNGIRQTFGRWEVRMRMPYSKAVKFVVQLWPTKGWPPEIDFAEGGGRNGTPQGFSAYMHWGTAADQKPGKKLQTVNRLSGIDMNDWHVVGLMWRPGSVQYTIDGRVWATVNSDNVPNEQMWLAIQTEATGPARANDPQPPDMQVDKVRIWSWIPATSESASLSS